MKTEIWCKSYAGTIKAKCVWKGELPIIPRIGEYVVVIDGWGAEEVKEIYHDLYIQTINIYIKPDHNDEYPEIP